MENEEVLENQPVENTETNEEDFFGEVDNEVIEEQENQNSEEESENQDSEPNETDTEEDDKEKSDVDFKPLLEELSKKVKYNKESVNVENIEDLVSNYQKGLNYDKLQEKFNNLQTSKAETYINKKAKELGLSVDEYIEEVERYEKEQEKAKEEARVEEMIESGVPEDVAREVIATSQLRKQLQAKENELKEKEAAAQREKDKDREFEEFIEAYPDVDADSIPTEVWKNSQNSSLKQAYIEWENSELKKKLSIKEQNEKNNTSSVGAVNENGTAQENKSRDLFLEGFESE